MDLTTTNAIATVNKPSKQVIQPADLRQQQSTTMSTGGSGCRGGRGGGGRGGRTGGSATGRGGSLATTNKQSTDTTIPTTRSTSRTSTTNKQQQQQETTSIYSTLEDTDEEEEEELKASDVFSNKTKLKNKPTTKRKLTSVFLQENDF